MALFIPYPLMDAWVSSIFFSVVTKTVCGHGCADICLNPCVLLVCVPKMRWDFQATQKF